MALVFYLLSYSSLAPVVGRVVLLRAVLSCFVLSSSGRRRDRGVVEGMAMRRLLDLILGLDVDIATAL